MKGFFKKEFFNGTFEGFFSREDSRYVRIVRILKIIFMGFFSMFEGNV